MPRPRRTLLALAGLAGAATAVVPSLAAGEQPSGSATFTAVDYGWQANGSATGTSATIASGGTVTFSYPAGASDHNADFGTGPQPSTCVQTAGADSGPVPPVPHQPGPPGWSGTCTFNTPGTYTFFCDYHPYMTGTITVQAPGSVTTTTTPATTTLATTTAATTTATTTPPPTASTVPGSPPASGHLWSAVMVPRIQHGTRVHGSVEISHAGSGSRLEVKLFAGERSLAGRGRGLVAVGHLLHSVVPNGMVRFSVPLDARARRALDRTGSLTLRVLVTVEASSGARVSATRVVVVRS